MITVYGENTTVEQLRKIPVHRPTNARGYWKGIQHGHLVDAITDEVRCRKWEVTGCKFSVSGRHDTEMVGAFEIETPVQPPDGQSLSLGVVTSNDLKSSLKLLVGTTVAVCTNGMATGEIVLSNRHVRGFDLHDGIERGLDEYHQRAQHVVDVVAELQGTGIGDDEAEHLLMEAGRRRLMPWSRVGRVDAAYHSDEHRVMHGHGTAWSLLNAFTGVVKINPPWHQMRQMNGFRALLMA